MAFKVLPLGHKPPGFRGARLRHDGGQLTSRGTAYVDQRIKQRGVVSSASAASQRRPVVPLGIKDVRTAATAESHVQKIMRHQHESLGTKAGLFGTANSDNGKPPYAPGLAKATIVQPLQSPYKARFTFGTPRF